MAYRDCKDLTRRTAAGIAVLDKALNIAKNPKYDGYWCGIFPIFYNLFDKRTSNETAKNKNIYNKELAENLGKQKYTHIL